MTFGDQLLQFALSSGSLGQGQVSDLFRTVELYTRQSLDIEHTKLYLATSVDGEKALARKRMPISDTEIVERLRDHDGKHRGHAPLCFERGKPLWLISKDGRQNLETAKGYKDLWSGLRKISRYRSQKGDADAEDPVKTSICLPLRRRGTRRVFGVINFRTSLYVEITDDAKEELTKIAEAVSIMLRLLETSKLDGETTNRAIDALEQSRQRYHPRLTKPMVFVASSSRADPQVVASVEKVLEAHGGQVGYVFWKRMDAPGNIVQQLIEKIGSCRYGICYLSEPTEDGTFRDNPNAVFEAGMFHGRTSHLTGSASPWIAIREPGPPEPFFDIAQERLLLVQRDAEGGLAAGAFETALASRLGELIADDQT